MAPARQADLEGLVPHEDVAIQREAELSTLEEPRVSLRVLAVCASQASPARQRCPSDAEQARQGQRCDAYIAPCA